MIVTLSSSVRALAAAGLLTAFGAIGCKREAPSTPVVPPAREVAAPTPAALPAVAPADEVSPASDATPSAVPAYPGPQSASRDHFSVTLGFQGPDGQPTPQMKAVDTTRVFISALDPESRPIGQLAQFAGAELHAFRLDPASLPDLDGPAEPWRERLGAASQLGQSLLLLIDPSAPAINDLISGLDYAYPQAVKVGGVACPHSASHGSLLFDDGVCDGAVGLLIGGGWAIEPVLCQGCWPIGPVLEVEQAQRNVVLAVSDGEQRRTPVAALQAILGDLSAEEREQVRNALFVGVGRSDFNLSGLRRDGASFLVRNLIGVDPRNGAVAVAEPMRVGQKLQFQLRDGDASRQEASQLLADLAATLPQPPLASLLFACLGRGQGLYGEPDGDVSLCRQSFPAVPIAGVFCNGEIGPLAGTTHLHGYTASWAFLVPHQPDAAPTAPG